MLNGARRANGNWVIPNELGNELGNDHMGGSVALRQRILGSQCLADEGVLSHLANSADDVCKIFSFRHRLLFFAPLVRICAPPGEST